MSTPAYEEGRQAAAQGLKFSDACPYLFNRSKFSQDEFNYRVRPLMDQWFRGWKDWLDENGLGFTFKPNNSKKKKKP